MTKRVVITGLGPVSPIGIGKEEFGDSLFAGKSGAKQINFEGYDMGQYTTKIACPIENFSLLDNIEHSKDLKILGRTSMFAMSATKLALEDSGLKVDIKANGKNEINYQIKSIGPFEIGVILGVGSEMSDVSEGSFKKLITHRGPKRTLPFEFPQTQLSCVTGNISKKFNVNGTTFTVATACASGTDAIIEAYKQILYGEENVIITGGSDACITPPVFAGFVAVKAMSKKNDHPEKASRPFDKHRDGFVMGEGAGILVLEELTHALERGAKIYCELIGFGKTNDGYHMTSPNPSAEPQSEAIKRALKSAGIGIEDVDYINAHGTSTKRGDSGETKAIKLALGAHSYKIPVSSTKSMTGHLLGACGSIETIATAIMINRKKIHPTINLEEQDHEGGCDLYYVPDKAIDKTINIALKNSFGFGGYNSVIALKKYEE